jgi:hypothetical protein
MAVTFFKSAERPGLSMNRFGVVFAERSHELANNELWAGVEWSSVPLKSGNLDVKNAIEDEAYAAGYRASYDRRGDKVYKKPVKASKKELATT